MKQQKQVEKLLQFAQRKKNQLLGMQPNQELNALIITDQSHRKHKEIQTTFENQREPESRTIKSEFVLALKEEDFKAKEIEGFDQQVRAIPQLPDLDMKMMPTFKDIP